MCTVRARTTRVSNPVCSPSFRASVSGVVQGLAFATGVPLDIYAFHCYTENSSPPSNPRAREYSMQFPGWARGFHTELTSPPTHPLRPVNPNNAWDLCITAAAGTELAVPSSFATINRPAIHRSDLLANDRGLRAEAIRTHAASLHQAFAHCEKFSTAATRRCLDRVSVPVWLVVLSDQLPVLALVGRYLTN